MSADSDRIVIDTAAVWPKDTDEDEGVVVNWFLNEGGHIEEGAAVCEIQIEKVSYDIPAPATGTLDEIAVQENGAFKEKEALGWIRPD